MSGIIMSLKAIRDAADEAVQLAQLGETADLLDRIDFMADQGKSITEQLKQILCPMPSVDPGKNPKMSPQKAALHIQRYATEAIEGLRTQGATADTEHRLVDIRALALGIANDLQPVERSAISKARIATAQRRAIPGIAEIKDDEPTTESEIDTVDQSTEKNDSADLNTEKSESKDGPGLVSGPDKSESKPGAESSEPTES